MQKKIEDILFEYTKGLLEIYGPHIKSIILYGSYARGIFICSVI